MSRVSDGTYAAKPVAIGDGPIARLGASKTKKSPHVFMWFEITDGPNKGARLPWFGYLTGDSTQRTIEALRLCGFEGDNIYDVEKQTLKGNVLITVENTVYKGKDQCRVAWVNDPSWTGEIEIQALDDKTKKTLEANLKKFMGA